MNAVATSPLTERQTEVLQLVADGLFNKQIAKTLFLTEETVKTHLRNILATLGATSRAHAVAIAFRHGFVA